MCLGITKVNGEKNHWAPYLIDEVKGTFGLRGSSLSESNHASVKNFVLEYTDGMHGAMYELMMRQKKLMLTNHELICHEYLQMNIIKQSHSLQGTHSNTFLFQASYFLCVKGFNIIKKSYINSQNVIYKNNSDGTISFYNLENNELPYKLKSKNDNCSCYIAVSQMMQCKHMISFNNKFDLDLIGRCWHKRDKITQSKNIGSYICPSLKNNIPEIDDVDQFPIINFDEKIIEKPPAYYEEIDINEIDTDLLCCNSTSSNNDIRLKNRVAHSSYMNICNSLYNNMKNDNKTSNIVVGLLLEVNEIILSNENKQLIYDNLSNRVDNYKNAFTSMKDNQVINFIEPSKRSPKESNKRKKSIYEISTRCTAKKLNNCQ